LFATLEGIYDEANFSNRYCSLCQYLKGACHLSKIGNEFSIFVASDCSRPLGVFMSEANLLLVIFLENKIG